MRQVKYLILGAGSAGLTALGRIRKLTDDFVLINGGSFGTTCARVGCMPSKALIHCAEHIHASHRFKEFGINGSESLTVDGKAILQRVRAFRDRFTQGVISGSTDSLKPEQLIRGYARFVNENTVEVNGELIQAERIILATGSRPVVPEPWLDLGERLLTSDNLFELETLPKSVAVIGLGIIGLELGQALSRLGVEVTGIEMAPSLTCVKSPAMANKLYEQLSKEFPLYLGKTAKLDKTTNGIEVSIGDEKIEVERVVAALGRRPNIDQVGIENIGVQLSERGMPPFNVETGQIADKPIFIAGDVNVFRPILHEASHEGAIAAENAISYPTIKKYQRKTALGVAFIDPQLGFFGANYSELDLDNTVVAEFNLERNNCRAIVMGQDHGLLVFYADKSSKCLLGGEIFMPEGEHITHLLAWAVSQKMTIQALLAMPFYHPVLEEAVESTLRLLAQSLYTKAELAECI